MNDRAKPSPPAAEHFVIPSLDGLRAVSFFFVFFAHAGVPNVPGGFGVTVFFFLSGYLITTLLRLELEHAGRIDLSHFYLRRVFRILPPFYLVLLLANALVLTGVVPGKLALPSVLSQVLHYSNYWIAAHGWDGIAPGTGVYWSLAVEEHFYLIFPALYGVLNRAGLSRPQQQRALWTFCALALVWRCVLVLGLHAPVDRTYLTTDGRWDSMLFGCALAVHHNPALDAPRGERPSLAQRLWLALGLSAIVVSFLVRSDTFRETLRYTVQGLGLYPVFVTAIRYPGWLPFRLLNLRPVRYVGVLSYSMYLIHQVVLYALEARLSSPLLIGCSALAATLLLSSLMYRFVEKPFARIRKRLAARPAHPSPAVAA